MKFYKPENVLCVYTRTYYVNIINMLKKNKVIYVMYYIWNVSHSNIPYRNIHYKFVIHLCL